MYTITYHNLFSITAIEKSQNEDQMEGAAGLYCKTWRSLPYLGGGCNQDTTEPHHEKICLRGFRPGKTKIGLLSYRDQLEYWNCGYSKLRYYTIQAVNTKSAGWSAPLLFAYGINRFFMMWLNYSFTYLLRVDQVGDLEICGINETHHWYNLIITSLNNHPELRILQNHLSQL